MRSPQAAVRQRVALLAATILGLVLSGCGSKAGPKLPPLGDVQGVVKLDGQPVNNAFVMFTPENARPSTGRTDGQGHYKLDFNDRLAGAAIGTHTVKISLRDDKSTKGNLEQIPAKYNDKTTLKETVKEGSNEINFDLTSQK